jgi:hypothetical protein
MLSMRNVPRLTLIVGLLLLPTWVLAQAATPSVQVSDQAIQNGTVTVDSIVSDGPGWIVIHADQNGAPGPVIGHSAVVNGENTDVTVEIDVNSATETLYAMLHTDAGTAGTYEFPGADGPVTVDGQVVVTPFTVTGGLPAAMPVTGGSSFPWAVALFGAGAAAILAGMLLLRSRRLWAARND